MDLFQSIVSWLVASASLVVWALFLPQIRLLHKVKEARSLSLMTIYGSFTIQSLIFLHALLGNDYKLAFLQSTSMLFLGIVIFMIHYYRMYPGGRAQ